jgi:tetratricopeptide (TPR) repeat protein
MGDARQAIVELERALGQPSGDPLARIACELRRSNVERNASNQEGAMRWALAAEGTLKRIDQPSLRFRAWVESMLGNALVVAGKPAQGTPRLKAAADMHEQAGPGNDLPLIYTLTNRAIALTEAGQQTAAVGDLLRAERLATERLPGGDVPAGVLVNLGSALRGSGRLIQADDAYQRAALAAQRHRGAVLEAAALLGLASTELARPSPDLMAIRPRLDEATRILDVAGVPEGSPIRGGVRHVRALALVAAGDLDKGDAELADLVRRHESFNAWSSAARALVYRAEVALRRGDIESAAGLLSTAFERAKRSQGDFQTSSAVATVLVWQAEVARRRGQTDAMGDLARQALHHALTSAGEDHPAALMARQLLAAANQRR